MAAASLCCSIEMEPRTLSEGQINQAREIAGSIAKRFEPSEADIIFTEGLKPLKSTREPMMMPEIKESDPRELITEKGITAIVSSGASEKAPILEKPCQCSLTPLLEESPTQGQAMAPREPNTAPF